MNKDCLECTIDFSFGEIYSHGGWPFVSRSQMGNKLVTEIKILLRVILRLCNYIELVQFKELIQQVQET